MGISSSSVGDVERKGVSSKGTSCSDPNWIRPTGSSSRGLPFVGVISSLGKSWCCYKTQLNVSQGTFILYIKFECVHTVDEVKQIWTAII